MGILETHPLGPLGWQLELHLSLVQRLFIPAMKGTLSVLRLVIEIVSRKSTSLCFNESKFFYQHLKNNIHKAMM